ncbi:hypothetical protein PEL8287_00623 [Roseovarius litorisediminis]|uniref:Uncharacterized protein n=1 Tax=Roseovarius litorisediminis TaxID=1312363 RepID=A0A1Y5RE82_9RHOB|nr:hypothetical protein PEL8287_00623 [Roseovarius litorisediminis]
MHISHSGNAASAALFPLNDSKRIPNSTLDGDSHMVRRLHTSLLDYGRA